MKKKCSCSDRAKLHTVKTHMTGTPAKAGVLDGQAVVIVPVVMARADVPMNGSLIPVDEFHPQSWNGVPVTVSHPPSTDGSANNPESAEKHTVGRIYNAAFDGVKLTGEAWVFVAKANEIYPGLVDRLESGDPFDVSTGYFCDTSMETGVVKGKEYNSVNTALKPDHLALLPDEEGACSWAEGCGVRSNQRSFTMNVKEALATIAKALKINSAEPKIVAPKKKAAKAKKNERGADDDRRQIIADLVSNDESPFVPDDEEALRFMCDDTLKRMQEDYLPSTDETETAEDEADETETAEDEADEAETAAEGEADEDEAMAAEDDVEEPMAAKKRSKTKMRKNCADGANKALTNADREALEFARKSFGEHRSALIEKIVANTEIDPKTVGKMDTATLEILANGIRPAADYSGRAMPVLNNESTSEDIKLMTSAGFVSAIRNSIKKEVA